MANRAKGLAATFLASALAAGCVSVRNENGLMPPVAICSHVRATVGAPKGPVSVACLKSGEADISVHIKEWFFSGASAGLLDMTLAKAARNGGLTKIHYADYEQTSILGFVTVFNLIAYGE